MYNGFRVQTIKDGEVELTINLIEDLNIGGYTVISPNYPEVIAEGGTLSEGIQNFTDALECMLETK